MTGLGLRVRAMGMGIPRLAGVFIDADNIGPRHAEMALCEVRRDASLRVGSLRAYKDWGQEARDSRGALAYRRLGVEQVQVDRVSRKNSSDIRMVVDIMESLLVDDMRHFVLITSDSDFRHVLHHVRKRGGTSVVYHCGCAPGLEAATDRSVRIEGRLNM